MKAHSDETKLFQLIKLLKKDLEIKLGYSLDGYSDFVNAAIDIKKLNNKELSVDESTLRNLWEQNKPTKIPYKKTLTIIVKSLGIYNDWDHYKTDKELMMQQGRLFDLDDPELNIEKMELGYEPLIGWYPIHYIKFKYRGSYKFEVLECSNTVKLKNGDIKYAIKFGVCYMEHFDKDLSSNAISGYPLYPSFVLKRPIDKTEEVEEEEILYNNIFI